MAATSIFVYYYFTFLSNVNGIWEVKTKYCLNVCSTLAFMILSRKLFDTSPFKQIQNTILSRLHKLCFQNVYVQKLLKLYTQVIRRWYQLTFYSNKCMTSLYQIPNPWTYYCNASYYIIRFLKAFTSFFTRFATSD